MNFFIDGGLPKDIRRLKEEIARLRFEVEDLKRKNKDAETLIRHLQIAGNEDCEFKISAEAHCKKLNAEIERLTLKPGEVVVNKTKIVEAIDMAKKTTEIPYHRVLAEHLIDILKKELGIG